MAISMVGNAALIRLPLDFEVNNLNIIFKIYRHLIYPWTLKYSSSRVISIKNHYLTGLFKLTLSHSY